MLAALLALVVIRVYRRMRRQVSTLQTQLETSEQEFEDAWQIPAADINLTKKLGEGGFGEVG